MGTIKFGDWNVVILSAIFLLTTSPASAKSLSPEDAQRIGTIAIKNTGNPSHYPLSVGNSGAAVALGVAVGPGAAAGVLAGSAAASGRATTLDEALASQHLFLGEEMVAAAEVALKGDGYELAKAQHSESADATLVFDIQDVGYVRRVWGLIGPRVIVQATLSDTQTGKTIFSQLYWYDMHAIGFGRKVLDPDEKYGFDTEAAVLAHPDIAAAGLRAMIPMMISDLVSALKKPSAP